MSIREMPALSQAFTVPAALGQMADEVMTLGLSAGVNARGFDPAGGYEDEPYVTREETAPYLNIAVSGASGGKAYVEVWTLKPMGDGEPTDIAFWVGGEKPEDGLNYEFLQSFDTNVDTAAVIDVGAGVWGLCLVVRSKGTAGALTLTASTTNAGVPSSTPVTGKDVGGGMLHYGTAGTTSDPALSDNWPRIGDTGHKLTAHLFDSAGATISITAGTWVSSDTDVATVDGATGAVTPVSKGPVTFTCTTNHSSYKISQTTEVKSAIIYPTGATFLADDVPLDGTPVEWNGVASRPILSATFTDRNGDLIDVSGYSPAVAWASRDEVVATIVDAGGEWKVTPRSRGVAAFSVTIDGLTFWSDDPALAAQSSPFTVVNGADADVLIGVVGDYPFVPEDGTAQLLGALLDAEGFPATGTVEFEASDPQFADCDSDGLVTAAAPGVAHFTAIHPNSPGDVYGTFSLTIVATGGAATARVTPRGGRAMTAAAGANHTKTFDIELYGIDGLPVTGRTVVWTSSDTNKATMNSSTGVATGIAAGTFHAIATVDGLAFTSATVTVS